MRILALPSIVATTQHRVHIAVEIRNTGNSYFNLYILDGVFFVRIQRLLKFHIYVPMSATLNVLPLSTSNAPSPVLLIIRYRVCHSSRYTVADKLRATVEPGVVALVAFNPFVFDVSPFTDNKSSTILKGKHTIPILLIGIKTEGMPNRHLDYNDQSIIDNFLKD